MQNHITKLQQELKPLRDALIAHPIYTKVSSLEDFRLFMQCHVFAVWDFMSQLKALQRHLTCLDLPWIPRGDAISCRFINEIVLAEESDHDAEGHFMSHFELYLKGMIEAGADPLQINQLVAQLSQGKNFEQAISEIALPQAITQFLSSNWEIVQHGSTHEIAAAFTFGREDLIPDMFRRLLNELSVNHVSGLETLKFYLERHINLDEEQHNPMAMKMLSYLCGEDKIKWQQASKAALKAMKARLLLWDGTLQILESQKNE